MGWTQNWWMTMPELLRGDFEHQHTELLLGQPQEWAWKCQRPEGPT